LGRQGYIFSKEIEGRVVNKVLENIVNYWDKQPCNFTNSTEKEQNLKFFNDTSRNRYFVEPHVRDFTQFHLYQGKRVLEIGCGIGIDAAEFIKNGAIYTGIDISQNSLSVAKNRLDTLGLHGELLCRNGDNISDLGEFDLVYSYGVLHHYPGISDIVDQVHKVLAINGEFKFMVYAKNSWKYAMILKGLDQYEAQAGCPYAKAYTKEDIYQLLDDKFSIARIRQAHCFMYNVEKYKQGIYELEPWFASMTDDMREAIKEYLGWHLLVKAIKI
jgi:2-polyprenyl-3-methyl-5-hydroxy-6-metoxy-1,4-benzoquinol methylase